MSHFMERTGRRAAVMAAAGCAAALAACATSEAPAAERAAAPAEREFTTAIGQMALEAQEQAGEGDHAAALATLDRALAAGPSDYERFVLLQIRGQTRFALEDLDGAIADLQGALDTGAPTPEEAAALNVNIGQMMIVNGDPLAGVDRVAGSWEQAGRPTDTVAIMLSQALAQEGEYERAVPFAEQARALADPVQRKHLDLLNFLYTELGREEEAEAIRREIAAL